MPRTSMLSKSDPHLYAQKSILDPSDQVLTALGDGARLAPSSQLRRAATLALRIVDLIPGVKDNQDAFRRLASDACVLVYAILCGHTTAERSATKISTDLLDIESLQEILETLTSVEKFAKKKASRNMIMRLIMRKSDFRTVQKLQATLRHSLDFFSLKSNIAIQEDLANIDSKQREILQAFRARGNAPEQGHLAQVIQTPNEGAGDALPGTVTPMPPFPLPRPFPNIEPSHCALNLSAVGHDQTNVDSSHHVSNSNSGNTVSMITKNSNNNSSVREVI